jgi:hypothetical protein
LAVTVAPLTAAVLAAAPIEHSGIASAINNDVARIAGLIAVAVLPTIAGLTGDSYLHPAVFSAGFHIAVLIAAGACVIGALIAVLTIRNPGRGAAEPPREGWQCALDAPPLFGENEDAPAGPSVIAGRAAGMGS